MDNGFTILRAAAENFRRLRFAALELLPGEGLVRVTGNNAEGKTTVLRMIQEAFGGAGEVLPDAVNVESEDGKGFLLIELSNGFSIERRFTENAPKGYLTVTGPDGGRHAQGKINEWLGPLSFDPLAFFGLNPTKQTDILLSSGKDHDLAAKIQANREKMAAIYDERTPWISQTRRARAVAKPEGERPEPIEIAAEMERLSNLRRAQAMRSEYLREIEEGERIIAANEARINVCREKIDHLQAEIENMDRTIRNAGAKINAAEQNRNQIPDPAADIQATENRIQEADQRARALKPWEAWDAAQAEIEEAKEKEQILTSALTAGKEAEIEMIQNAGIPITGLTFDDDGTPRLNGLGLANASGSERIRLAVEVALASESELRVCLIDEANDLDLAAMATLDEMAREHGFQVWAARIGLEGPGEIVCEDGIARSTSRPEPEEAAE